MLSSVLSQRAELRGKAEHGGDGAQASPLPLGDPTPGSSPGPWVEVGREGPGEEAELAWRQ